MRNNLRLLRIDTVVLNAWLKEGTSVSGLPDVLNTASLLLTLRDEHVVMKEKFFFGDEARVVILMQSGYSTPPAIVWPVLNHFCLVNRAQQPGVTLVLSGNTTFWRHQLWIRYLSLHTPGRPPVMRLLWSLFMRSLIREESRVVRILRRLIRRRT